MAHRNPKNKSLTTETHDNGTSWKWNPSSDSSIYAADEGISTLASQIILQPNDNVHTDPEVTDRDVASKAVALVISSTRHGIVSLCSEVANLLRKRNSLEVRVAELTKENAILRSISYRQRYSAPSSPQYSEDQRQNGAYYDEQPSLHYKKTFGVNADIHHHPISSPSNRTSTQSDNSLPERAFSPLRSAQKVCPKIRKVSRQTQCQLDKSIFSSSEGHSSGILEATLKANTELLDDLQKSFKEIQTLKARVKELEMHELARRFDRLQYEDECVSPNVSRAVSRAASRSASMKSKSSNEFRPAVEIKNTRRSLDSPSLLDVEACTVPASPTPSRSSSYSSYVMPGPMQGCRCKSCQQGVSESEGVDIGTSGLIVSDKKFKGERLHIETGDHIVIDRQRTGHVRYIGHLDESGTPNAVYVGIELDAPVGKHNGTSKGKRYFTCAKDYGLFVPLRTVRCIISKRNADRGLSLDQSLTCSSGSELSLQKMSNDENSNQTLSKPAISLQMSDDGAIATSTV